MNSRRSQHPLPHRNRDLVKPLRRVAYGKDSVNAGFLLCVNRTPLLRVRHYDQPERIAQD